MPLIRNRPQPFNRENREYDDAPLLPSGTHVVVMHPWPEAPVYDHKDMFHAGKTMNSWVLTLEGITNNGQKGGVVRLWLECDKQGQILGTERGEGCWAQIREALMIPESDEFNTDALSWAYLKVSVTGGVSKKGNAFASIPLKEGAIIRCDAEEQRMANDYMAQVHPEVP